MDVTSKKKKLPLIKKRKTLIGLLQLTTDTWRDEKLCLTLRVFCLALGVFALHWGLCLTLRVFCLALRAFALGVFVLH